MLTVICINCHRVVPVKELDEDSGFAVCRGCGAMFEVPSTDLDEARDDLPGLESYGRISTPPSYTLSTTGVDPQEYRGHVRRELAMSWPLEDAGPGRIEWLLISLLCWFGVYVMAMVWKGQETAIVTVFLTISSAPALTFTYPFLVLLFNRTHLTITDGLLRVRHAPLPWVGNHAIPVDDIQQLYCSRMVSGRHKGFISYRLNARMRSGETRPVVARLKHARTAMHLQQRIHEFVKLR